MNSSQQQYAVRLKAGSDPATVAASMGMRYVREIPSLGVFLFETDSNSLSDAAPRLKRTPEVEWFELQVPKERVKRD